MDKKSTQTCTCKTKQYHSKKCTSFYLNKYIQIKAHGEFPTLTIEDMIWIDNNVKENMGGKPIQ